MGKVDEIIKDLDQYDLDEFLTSDRPLYDAMEEIDAVYDVGLIGGLTEDEFASYIRKAYGLKCYERIVLFIK